MGVRKVEATEWICDACGKQAFTTGEKSPEGWLVGTASLGPVSGEWVVDKASCVSRAVQVATDSSQRSAQKDRSDG